IPHELGHGAFNLRHTFSEEATHLIEEGTTDNLMDYGRPPGTKLWKYQWDLIHDPENVLFAWTEEGEEGEIIDVSVLFDDDDLKKYNDLVNSLNKISLFETIYDEIDESDKHVKLRTLKATYDNLKELKKRYQYSNGYFLDAKKKEAFWGLIEYEPGAKINPHQIVLFSSKNYNLSGGEIKGNAFRNATTIYEEFYHAAHYLFLREKGSFENKTKFFIQTEAEIELAKALVYYIVKFKKKNLSDELLTTSFDNYGVLLQNNNEINHDVKDVFDEIWQTKKLSKENVNKIKSHVATAVEEKRRIPGYEKLTPSQVDWSFDFLKFVIKKSFN
ncbi:MAG: hypothetical protein ACQEQ0_03900, partial [Bacteroidota bacterium]